MSNELKSATTELADNLKQYIKIDKDGNADKDLLSQAFEKTLPEGVSVGQVMAVTTHFANLAPAMNKAAGEASIDAMSKNKKLDEVTVSMPITGKDTLDTVTKRSIPTRNPSTGEKGVKYGASATAFNFYAADNGRGELKKTRAMLGDLAEKALAEKE